MRVLLLPEARRDQEDPRHPAGDLHGVRDLPGIREREARQSEAASGAEGFAQEPLGDALRDERGGLVPCGRDYSSSPDRSDGIVMRCKRDEKGEAGPWISVSRS